ncbi:MULTISPECIES: c-type cytochrome [Neorhizobium]|uniref:Cytochrome C-556 n=1 Tax=Neorhizobium galegae bv. officinalis TaxID=323656 RepID=A0A0T7GDD6_NEOGA|nr:MULTISPECIES: cytochrome c [Neorhizobium]CDZ45156.1 Cytochrome C-556 [Neorhizobium galegae bv. officinalis]
MKLKLIAAAAAVLCLGFTAVTAQETPIAKRQALMKGIGGAAGALGGIAKGEKPYDQAAVRTALTTISTNIKAFPDQFPAGSETGDKTKAAPAIWEKNAEFRANAQKLGSDAEALLASMPADQAAVGKALQTLGGSCNTCHQNFRLK